MHSKNLERRTRYGQLSTGGTVRLKFDSKMGKNEIMVLTKFELSVHLDMTGATINAFAAGLSRVALDRDFSTGIAEITVQDFVEMQEWIAVYPIYKRILTAVGSAPNIEYREVYFPDGWPLINAPSFHFSGSVADGIYRVVATIYFYKEKVSSDKYVRLMKLHQDNRGIFKVTERRDDA